MFEYRMHTHDNFDRAARRRRPRRHHTTLIAAALGLGAACAPTVGRDLSNVPIGQVGFDDLCGLQNYFDALTVKKEAAPRIVSSTDIENDTDVRTFRNGRTLFAFDTDFQLATLRRILKENWKNLPPELDVTHQINVSVHWFERAGLRRLVTSSDVELIFNGQVTALPYQVCLSELLFGAPVYHERREALGLAPPPTALPLTLPPDADAGAPDDAGADGSPVAPSRVK
jgi:hypothetical protein